MSAVSASSIRESFLKFTSANNLFFEFGTVTKSVSKSMHRTGFCKAKYFQIEEREHGRKLVGRIIYCPHSNEVLDHLFYGTYLPISETMLKILQVIPADSFHDFLYPEM
jgi:hypothetical protein